MKQPLDDKSRIKDCTNSSTLNYPISVATNWFYFVFFLFFLLLILRANTLDFSSHELQLINVNQGSWHELFTQCAKEKTAPLPVHFLLRISQFLGQQTIHTRLPFLLLNLLFLILCFKKIILHFNNKLTLRFCLLLLLIPSVTTLFVGLTIIPFVLLLYYLLFPLLLKESIINLKSQFLITILATLIQPMLAIPVLLLLWFQSKTSFNWRTVIMGILSGLLISYYTHCLHWIEFLNPRNTQVFLFQSDSGFDFLLQLPLFLALLIFIIKENHHFNPLLLLLLLPLLFCHGGTTFFLLLFFPSLHIKWFTRNQQRLAANLLFSTGITVLFLTLLTFSLLPTRLVNDLKEVVIPCKNQIVEDTIPIIVDGINLDEVSNSLKLPLEQLRHISEEIYQNSVYFLLFRAVNRSQAEWNQLAVFLAKDVGHQPEQVITSSGLHPTCLIKMVPCTNTNQGVLKRGQLVVELTTKRGKRLPFFLLLLLAFSGTILLAAELLPASSNTHDAKKGDL